MDGDVCNTIDYTRTPQRQLEFGARVGNETVDVAHLTLKTAGSVSVLVGVYA